MVSWNIYLRSRRVFIPTVAKAEDGFFVDVDPVLVVERGDCDSIVSAANQVISAGNPTIKTPTRYNFPTPVVLAHAKVKSWSTFERGAVYWKVTGKTDSYQLHAQRKVATGGWENVPGEGKMFAGPLAINEPANALAMEIQSRK